MKCPNCESENYTSYCGSTLNIIMGSKNIVHYYICKDCGILFLPTKNNPLPEVKNFNKLEE